MFEPLEKNKKYELRAEFTLVRESQNWYSFWDHEGNQFIVRRGEVTVSSAPWEVRDHDVYLTKGGFVHQIVVGRVYTIGCPTSTAVEDMIHTFTYDELIYRKPDAS